MPCAACRLLRRRCAPECIFAPYFSTVDPQQFEVVHRIYGASNAAKILKVVPESHRAEAAKTLVHEAYSRLEDPVYGIMGTISGMIMQLEGLEADLKTLKAEILKRKLIMQSSSYAQPSLDYTSPTTTTTTTTPAYMYLTPPPPLPPSVSAVSPIICTTPPPEFTDLAPFMIDDNIPFISSGEITTPRY